MSGTKIPYFNKKHCQKLYVYLAFFTQCQTMKNCKNSINIFWSVQWNVKSKIYNEILKIVMEKI